MNTVSKPVVGFIGLGAMGGPMASNLQKAGYRLVVNDTRRAVAEPHLKAGAIWADTPRALAEQCEVIFSCLPGLQVIETVALGAEGVLAGIRPGHAYFEMSTSSPELVRRLDAAFTERGAHMLDAPISGGAAGAARGRLAIYVGGDKAAYQRYEPVLRALGDRPQYIGAVGTGLVTKLVHNCASQSVQMVLAEIFSMGVKAGAEPLALWEAVRHGAAGRRRTFDGLIDQFLPGKFDGVPSALRNPYKDILSATALARDVGAPMPIANLVLANLTEAINRGWADRGAGSVLVLAQERAGVKIAVEEAAIQEVLRRDPAAPTDTQNGPAD